MKKPLFVRSGKEGRLAVKSSIYESCVLCNRETDIEVMKHIGERPYYVEGGGQLCMECYQQVYQNKGR